MIDKVLGCLRLGLFVDAVGQVICILKRIAFLILMGKIIANFPISAFLF